MNAITLQLRDEMLQKMTAIAAERGLSVDSLLSEVAERIVDDYDAEQRFKKRAANGAGREAEALELLDRK